MSWQVVREWLRSTLGVTPPSKPRVSDALVRAMLAQQQQAIAANRQVLADLADTLTPDERQQIAKLLDDNRFTGARRVD